MYTKLDIFDGSNFKQKSAYKIFKEKVLVTGNIWISFSPIKYNKVDIEQGINIHFEIPNIDAFGGICFMRLYLSCLGTVLSNFLKNGVDIEDDVVYVIGEVKKNGIILKKSRATICDYSMVNNSFIGYIGMSNKGGDNSPSDFYDLNINLEEFPKLIGDQLLQMFYQLTTSIFKDTCKI